MVNLIRRFRDPARATLQIALGFFFVAAAIDKAISPSAGQEAAIAMAESLGLSISWSASHSIITAAMIAELLGGAALISGCGVRAASWGLIALMITFTGLLLAMFTSTGDRPCGCGLAWIFGVSPRPSHAIARNLAITILLLLVATAPVVVRPRAQTLGVSL